MFPPCSKDRTVVNNEYYSSSCTTGQSSVNRRDEVRSSKLLPGASNLVEKRGRELDRKPKSYDLIANVIESVANPINAPR